MLVHRDDMMMMASARSLQEDDSDDMDHMDTLGFDDKPMAPAEEESDSDLEFHDAGTWSSDEEDSVSKEACLINGFFN
jgi:hypothetical protein